MSSETKTMKKKSKRTLTPKLRFAEFRDELGWESESLGRLFANRQEKGFSELPLLSVTDERGIIPQEETNRRDNSNSDKSRYLRVVPGDIAYNTMRMWEGRSAYVDREGLVSPAYTVCQPQNEIHGKFFSYYFKTSTLIEQFRKYSQGLVKDTLSLKYNGFACISVPSPQFAEQQKIAECLSSLDWLIATEGRKLAALRDHKRGLMQHLFPQPGQTQPRLRFPEFRDKGEWKTIILGDVVSISKGKGVAKSDVVASGTIPCIRYAELYTIYGEVITHVHSRTDVPVDTLVLSQAGDVIIPASGETKEDIATCGCVMNAGVALGGDLNVLRSDIDGRFFSYYLNGVQRSELAKVAQGHTVSHLYPSQISRLSISVTEEPAEQWRIADCLTALDTRITAQAVKIETLKQHKRGLMQQLFPAPEEV